MMRYTDSPMMASPDDPSMLDPNNGAPHQCGICYKVFVSTKGLLQHSIIHTDRKPFNCEICGKPFRFKSNLFEHRSIHSGVQPYVCPFCGKACRLKGNLKKHLKTHVKEPEELDRAYEAVTGGHASDNEEADYYDEMENTPTRRNIATVTGLAALEPPRRRQSMPMQPTPAVVAAAAVSQRQKLIKQTKMVMMFNKEPQESNYPMAMSEYPPLSEMMSNEYSVLEFARAALNGGAALERYECPLCELLFASRCEMSAHIDNAHEGQHASSQDTGLIWCEACLRPFDDTQAAQQHATYHQRVALLIQTGNMTLNDAMMPVRF